MGGGGGGGSPVSINYIRYAPYIESRHQTLLSNYALYRAEKISESPFEDFTKVPVEDAFFGSGYIISSFPSLFDMFGKFMAGLDIETLYDQTFEEVVNAPVVNELILAEAALMDDDIESNTLPRFQIGMRDANAVMTSSFVIGKALIEDARIKSLSKFSAQLKTQMIPYAVDKWKTHLEWNKNVVTIYAELMKFYFMSKMDVENFNYENITKNILWPFTVLEYERVAVGTLQGATTSASKGPEGGPSTGQKVLGSAMSGAAVGAMIFPEAAPVAAGIGAVVGGIGGLLS